MGQHRKNKEYENVTRDKISNLLWARIEPLIPPDKPKIKSGRPRISDQKILAGLVFIAKTGTAWRKMPAEFECGSGMTCWRRLLEWQKAGVWTKIWELLAKEFDLPRMINPRWAESVKNRQRSIFDGWKKKPFPKLRHFEVT